MRKNNMFNQKLEQIGGENIVDGITLKSEDKEKILNFINANTNQNYILNDNKLEKEKNEQEIKNTLLDEEIDCAIKENRKILIALSENVENVIEMYISEDNTERLILIDKDFCEKDNLEDIALADRLTKALFITHENDGIALLSSTAVKAVIATSSNVYHGPDSSNYAKVGSIDAGEDPVYILATSMGWYHIEYLVTSTGKHKTGYIPASVVSSYSGGELTEEDFYGGYCYATTELDVRTCDDFSLTAPVGTLFKHEGCTFLFSYNMGNNEVAFIEYATSSGTKRGYVYSKYLKFPCETIVCVAKENIPVYGGPSSNTYAHFGTIYQNELMSLLAKESNWIYVEYNTTKGRKRGYVDWTKVDPRDYTSGTYFNDFYKTPSNSDCHINDESQSVAVYGGPSTSYSKIGSVNCENITCFWTNNDSYADLTCIEYVVSSTGLLKRGYIDPNKANLGLLTLENNTIEEFNSDSIFTKVRYGYTQLERPMHYLRAGSGPKHIFLVFALHGWEDGKKSDGSFYHGDGNILLKIAKSFINKFNNMNAENRNTILNNWTIFLFPGVNLDGIVNGYSNNSFGRCLYNGVDPNRSFPGNFVEFTNPRNKTTSTSLNGAELVNLRNCLMGNRSSNENILLDIHGWENSFITNSSELADYFVGTFKSLNSSFRKKNLGVASGYLTTWAENKPTIASTNANKPGLGARSALLEFPPTTNYSSSNIDLYSDKLFTATTNLLLDRSTTTITKGKNDELYEKLEEIYNFAKDWNDSDDVLENNKLVLDYLRHEDYSSAGSITDIPFDVISASTAKTDFYKYVKKHAVGDLDISNMKVFVKNLNDSIGLAHWAVTTLTQINQTDPYCLDLSGWAGDLISFLAQCQKKYKTDNSKYNYSTDTLSQLIGCTKAELAAANASANTGFEKPNNTYFDFEDLYQDIDAVNLATNLAGAPIYTVLKNYYDNGGDGSRISQFISNVIRTSTKIAFPSGASNEDKLEYIARQYTAKEMKTPALLAFFQLHWGDWEESVWGAKAARAFRLKILRM